MIKTRKEAIAEAKSVLARMKTRGWKIFVHKNMGWHWSLVNRLCGMSLHRLFDSRKGIKFWAMMADGTAKEVTHGSSGIYCTKQGYFADPNKAVEVQFASAMRWFSEQMEGMKNLQSIKPTPRKVTK